jgi:hypothetical protein
MEPGMRSTFLSTQKPILGDNTTFEINTSGTWILLIRLIQDFPESSIGSNFPPLSVWLTLKEIISYLRNLAGIYKLETEFDWGSLDLEKVRLLRIASYSAGRIGILILYVYGSDNVFHTDEFWSRTVGMYLVE